MSPPEVDATLVDCDASCPNDPAFVHRFYFGCVPKDFSDRTGRIETSVDADARTSAEDSALPESTRGGLTASTVTSSHQKTHPSLEVVIGAVALVGRHVMHGVLAWERQDELRPRPRRG